MNRKFRWFAVHEFVMVTLEYRRIRRSGILTKISAYAAVVETINRLPLGEPSTLWICVPGGGAPVVSLNCTINGCIGSGNEPVNCRLDFLVDPKNLKKVVTLSRLLDERGLLSGAE